MINVTLFLGDTVILMLLIENNSIYAIDRVMRFSNCRDLCVTLMFTLRSKL